MKVYKNAYGWAAESEFDMPGKPNHKIQFLTMKRWNGAIGTTVKVEKIEGKMRTYQPFSDYNKTLASRAMRATEKSVAAEHEALVVKHKDECIKEAVAFYNAEGN